MNLYLSHSLVVFLSAIAFLTCEVSASTSSPLDALTPPVATRAWYNPAAWVYGRKIAQASDSSNTIPAVDTSVVVTSEDKEKINDLSDLGNAFLKSDDGKIDPPLTPPTPPADAKKTVKSTVIKPPEGTDSTGVIIKPVVADTSISGTTTTTSNTKVNSVVKTDETDTNATGDNTNATGDDANTTGDDANATGDNTNILEDDDATLKDKNPDNIAKNPKSKRNKSFSSHEESLSSDESADKKDSSWSGGKITLVVIGTILSAGALGGIGYTLYRRSKSNE